MSIFATTEMYSRGDDWLIASVFLVVFYVVLHPLYIIYTRLLFTRRIKNQLVTSAYKLPIDLAPAELAYIFSTKVSIGQIYATLLDLANRSILRMDQKEDKTYVGIGPKVDTKLKSFESTLVRTVESSDSPVELKFFMKGETMHRLASGESVNGSKQYVFWWLLRDTLRKKAYIQDHMTGRYLRMLSLRAVLNGVLISLLPLSVIRVVQLLNGGEVDTGHIAETFISGLLLWLLLLPLLFIASFFLLRFKGRMLGRSWLLTSSFKRYLGQLDAFREFVRLTHKDKLRFESKELKKESLDSTRAYAIACGFVKEQKT